MHIEIPNGNTCFYAILGLPSSGTSIISRFFHSIDNGFCIGEPFYNQPELDEKKIFIQEHIDKIGQMQFYGSPAFFLTRLHTTLKRSPYSIGGIKEVCLYKDQIAPRFEACLSYPHFDCFVFIHRDPKANFNSLKRRGSNFGTITVNEFIESWQCFLKLKKKLADEGYHIVTLSYEEFCQSESQLDYVNQAFGDHATFKGQFELTPVKQPFWLAVEKEAINSNKINMPKMDYPFLKWEEIQMIDAYCPTSHDSKNT